MRNLPKFILDNLQIDNQAARKTRDKIKSVLDKPQKARELVNKIQAENSLYSCIQCDTHPFCSLFLACVFYSLDEIKDAQIYAEKAIKNLELYNMEWNVALASWLYGDTYVILRQGMQARRELEKTIKLLSVMSKEFRWDDNYEARERCAFFISKIEKSLKKMNKDLRNEKRYYKETTSRSDKFPQPGKPVVRKRHPWRRSRLIFPVYSQLHAGKEGNFIFENEPDLEAILDQLEFSGVMHYLYNLKEEGDPIIFSSRVHRWFRVSGNSMNRAEPVAINDGDYVLMIDTILHGDIKSQVGDIVVANLYNPMRHERAGVVKKRTVHGLESQSVDEYPIIPLKKATIRGIAIAVAKPDSNI